MVCQYAYEFYSRYPQRDYFSLADPLGGIGGLDVLLAGALPHLTDSIVIMVINTQGERGGER